VSKLEGLHPSPCQVTRKPPEGPIFLICANATFSALEDGSRGIKFKEGRTGAGKVVQMIKHLPSKCEAQSSNCSTTQKKKKAEQRSSEALKHLYNNGLQSGCQENKEASKNNLTLDEGLLDLHEGFWKTFHKKDLKTMRPKGLIVQDHTTKKCLQRRRWKFRAYGWKVP
jgi:hypothetical protein